MNNKAKTRKAAVAGVVGLTAAGFAATMVLANDPAADTADSKAVERQESAFAQKYTGPRTADAAEAWLESETAYTGPRTADAAEAWLESETAHTGPRTADAAEAWLESETAYTGPRTADAAEAWLESETAHTGPAPVEPVMEHPVSAPQCVVTADTAEHWIRATGHLPCEP